MSISMIHSINNTFQDLIDFLKNPEEKQSTISDNKFKIQSLFSILFIDLLLMIPTIGVISLMEFLGLFDSETHALEELLREHPLLILITGISVKPFIEEMIFRLHLRIDKNVPIQLLIGMSSILGHNTQEKVKGFIRQRWIQNYSYIFYLSAFVFAMIHISNYEFSAKILIISPIILMPQFIIGLLLGFLRVKFGLMWGFYLHSLHNLIFLSISIATFTNNG